VIRLIERRYRRVVVIDAWLSGRDRSTTGTSGYPTQPNRTLTTGVTVAGYGLGLWHHHHPSHPATFSAARTAAVGIGWR
jgi:hypothetical protein